MLCEGTLKMGKITFPNKHLSIYTILNLYGYTEYTKNNKCSCWVFYVINLNTLMLIICALYYSVCKTFNEDSNKLSRLNE